MRFAGRVLVLTLAGIGAAVALYYGAIPVIWQLIGWRGR